MSKRKTHSFFFFFFGVRCRQLLRFCNKTFPASQVLSSLFLMDAIFYFMILLYFQFSQVRFQHGRIHESTGEVISMCCSLCAGKILIVVFCLNLDKEDNVIC